MLINTSREFAEFAYEYLKSLRADTAKNVVGRHEVKPALVAHAAIVAGNKGKTVTTVLRGGIVHTKGTFHNNDADIIRLTTEPDGGTIFVVVRGYSYVREVGLHERLIHSVNGTAATSVTGAKMKK